MTDAQAKSIELAEGYGYELTEEARKTTVREVGRYGAGTVYKLFNPNARRVSPEVYPDGRIDDIEPNRWAKMKARQFGVI